MEKSFPGARKEDGSIVPVVELVGFHPVSFGEGEGRAGWSSMALKTATGKRWRVRPRRTRFCAAQRQ